MHPGRMVWHASFTQQLRSWHAKRHQHSSPTALFSGLSLAPKLDPQADGSLLAEVVSDASEDGEGFDVIVDDGGHHPDMQMASLAGLWPALKSGGVYIVEVSRRTRGACAQRTHERMRGAVHAWAFDAWGISTLWGAVSCKGACGAHGCMHAWAMHGVCALWRG